MGNVTSVNLRKIAMEAGVSHMTVSRVLRGAGRVAEETRERVMRVAGELGYRPNPLVQAYAAQVRRGRAAASACNLAWLPSDPEGRSEPLPWAKPYLEGAQARAEELGFPLDTTLNAHGVTDARLERIFESRGIRGIVLPQMQYHDRHPFQGERTAEVGIGENPDARPMHAVTADFFKNVTTCVDALLGAGYRRIGFCEHDHSVVVSQAMHWGSYLWNQHRLEARLRVISGLPLRPETVAASRRKFLDWVEAEKPDAVIVTFYQAGAWLREAGIRAPQDIGLAHLALTPDVEGWSGIDQNPAEIGAAAVEMLVGNILHNEYGVPERPRILRLPGSWVQGKTTRPMPKRAPALPQSHTHSHEWFGKWFWKNGRG